MGGYERRAAYCASKAGMVNLTRALAVEWARYGVRVNCVGPTFVESATNMTLFQDESSYQETVARIPAGSPNRPISSARLSILPRPRPAWSLVTPYWLMGAGPHGNARGAVRCHIQRMKESPRQSGSGSALIVPSIGPSFAGTGPDAGAPRRVSRWQRDRARARSFDGLCAVRARGSYEAGISSPARVRRRVASARNWRARTASSRLSIACATSRPLIP